MSIRQQRFASAIQSMDGLIFQIADYHRYNPLTMYHTLKRLEHLVARYGDTDDAEERAIINEAIELIDLINRERASDKPTQTTEASL